MKPATKLFTIFVKNLQMKFRIIICLLFFHLVSSGQDDSKKQSKTLSLLFIGDVMGHETQINSAKNPDTGEYEYDPCFKYIKDEMSDADYTIANLEVTLGTLPYSGYPQFSSPSQLPIALRNAGVDCLLTANNHSADRRKKGIEKTIDILDSLNIPHTGTYKDTITRLRTHPMILEKNGIKVALMNYTYGTNGIPVSHPNYVNMLRREIIMVDLQKAKSLDPDKIIICFHWGNEYQSKPSEYQKSIYNFCISNGADIIIGSHPHVLQRIEHNIVKTTGNENLVAYSLGNFISNQRTRKRDGGAMIRITLEKNLNECKIIEAGYYLTWVYNPYENGQKKFYILPVSKYENNSEFFRSKIYFDKMNVFKNDSRQLFQHQNINVGEYIFDPSTKNWLFK